MRVTTKQFNGAEEFRGEAEEGSCGEYFNIDVHYLPWDSVGGKIEPQLYVGLNREDGPDAGGDTYMPLHAARALRDWLVKVLP